MKNSIYSVKDVKVGTFYMPFTKTHKNEAIRDFTTVVNESDNKLNLYPEDFELWELGEMDMETGKIESFTNPSFVVCAINVINKKQIKGETDNGDKDTLLA